MPVSKTILCMAWNARLETWTAHTLKMHLQMSPAYGAYPSFPRLWPVIWSSRPVYESTRWVQEALVWQTHRCWVCSIPSFEFVGHSYEHIFVCAFHPVFRSVSSPCSDLHFSHPIPPQSGHSPSSFRCSRATSSSTFHASAASATSPTPTTIPAI